MRNCNQKSAKIKPAKPYAGYPLFAHPSGQWARKVKGKTFYFGKWADPIAAKEKHDREIMYLREGRQPPPVDVGDGCTIRTLCNAFLSNQEDKLRSGELAPRTFQVYHLGCGLLVEILGEGRLVADLRPDDFQRLRAELSRRYSVVSLRSRINTLRIIFSYGWKNNLVDRPPAYGSAFDKPRAAIMRKDRNEGGNQIFTREEILLILDYLDGKPVMVDGAAISGKPDPVMTAMVLLALNAGFGNTDCATLPQAAVDLKNGFIDFPRPKTAIDRRIPLWSRTAAALQQAIKARPKAKDTRDGGLCFLTARGCPWVTIKQKPGDRPDFVSSDLLGQRFKRILNALHINGRRRLNFYKFRHVFETQAGESRDQVAVDSIMGHVDPSMGANYRHGVSDERLRAVVGVVENWLFAKE